ncbi:MAG TPA: ATP-dependent metallopeptidase FtsH/Yme1/Tma family protein, partial [Gammaproteobacteria bacterium]|nr:ATP-dependent metallopeptidase FtsH/Yme1/Tma family protein [Gammaproteobacteria bacterium]
MNDLVKNLILWGVIAVILLSVFSHFSQQVAGSNEVAYSDFIAQVKSGNVKQVMIAGREITGKMQDDQAFKTYSPETDNNALMGDLLSNKVLVNAKPPEQQSLLMSIFISWFPFLLLIGIWVFFMRQMQGGGGGRGAMSFGKSRAR